MAERAGEIVPLRGRVREIVAKNGGGKNIVGEVLRAELHDA